MFCIGVDEAGRGPLAGPVFAAAVCVPHDWNLPGLTDSKALTARQRDRLFDEIIQHATAYSIAEASVAEIDELNILQANLLAMRRAIEALPEIFHPIYIDGRDQPRLNKIPHGRMQAVIGGDRLMPSISAASILAKVSRDRLMQDLALKYPEYGFAQHKGYGTQQHLAALKLHGPCPAHRQSFAPVRAAISPVFPLPLRLGVDTDVPESIDS
jgi:ribonuclease HII